MEKRKLTEDDIVVFILAEAVNQWLHRKGDEVFNYHIFLDRTMEIAHDVLRPALAKAKQAIAKYAGQIGCERCNGTGDENSMPGFERLECRLCKGTGLAS